jgi:hypothetical protein
LLHCRSERVSCFICCAYTAVRVPPTASITAGGEAARLGNALEPTG